MCSHNFMNSEKRVVQLIDLIHIVVVYFNFRNELDEHRIKVLFQECHKLITKY